MLGCIIVIVMRSSIIKIVIVDSMREWRKRDAPWGERTDL